MSGFGNFDGEDEDERALLKPVWEDDPGDESPLSWLGEPRPKAGRKDGFACDLLSLSRADDALSRLDALVGVSPQPLQDGMVSRIAITEAAGWLAAHEVWIHPNDLVLREARLTGNYLGASLKGVLGRELPSTFHGIPHSDTPSDHAGEAAIVLARLLRRLASSSSWDPLSNGLAFKEALAQLGSSTWPCAGALGDTKGVEFARWKEQVLPRKTQEPALLVAARAAAAWHKGALEGGAAQPQASQAILVSAMVLKKLGRVQHVPGLFWSAMHTRMRRHPPVFHPPDWPNAYLADVAASAVAALQEFRGLQSQWNRAQELVATVRSHSRLPAFLKLAFERPLITAAMAAEKLDISLQAALSMVKRMEDHGILKEATGRDSFRAYRVA